MAESKTPSPIRQHTEIVIKGAREYRRIACLEITIVFALVGEKEIAPDEGVGDLPGIETVNSRIELSLERFQALRVFRPRARDMCCILVDHRQRKIQSQCGAKGSGIHSQRMREGFSRL